MCVGGGGGGRGGTVNGAGCVCVCVGGGGGGGVTIYDVGVLQQVVGGRPVTRVPPEHTLEEILDAGLQL